MRTIQIFIDVADNGYYCTVERPTPPGGESPPALSTVHMTAYKLGQYIEGILPRPAEVPLSGAPTAPLIHGDEY